MLFITVYHSLFVLWLVVAYSGLSRYVLLGYEPRPTNTFLLTIDYLSFDLSSLFINLLYRFYRYQRSELRFISSAAPTVIVPSVKLL
jgi:hypothetical protein